jgi:chemotaxis signal transduction protein
MLVDANVQQPVVENKSEAPTKTTALTQNTIFPKENLALPSDADTLSPATLAEPILQHDKLEKPLTETVDDVDSAPSDNTHTDESATTIAAENIQTKSAVIKLLLCDIGGMKVSIAVDSLDNIVRWPEKDLSYIPGRKSWEVALYNDNGQNTNVIDIRSLLHSPECDAPLKANYILLVNDRRTGIACDAIEQIINKNTSEINWRNDTSQRPWFTGVLSETMHSILDIPAIIKALEG